MTDAFLIPAKLCPLLFSYSGSLLHNFCLLALAGQPLTIANADLDELSLQQTLFKNSRHGKQYIAIPYSDSRQVSLRNAVLH